MEIRERCLVIEVKRALTAALCLGILDAYQALSMMKREKTSVLAIGLAITGLFAYSEVIKKEHQIHLKQAKYNSMVNAVHTNR
jgi:hypothetical protein